MSALSEHEEQERQEILRDSLSPTKAPSPTSRRVDRSVRRQYRAIRNEFIELD